MSTSVHNLVKVGKIIPDFLGGLKLFEIEIKLLIKKRSLYLIFKKIVRYQTMLYFAFSMNFIEIIK